MSFRRLPLPSGGRAASVRPRAGARRIGATGMTDQPSLDELRREIDAIDDRIHRELMRRTEVVARVAAVKGGGALALRPGREARILRQLAKRHRGPFPLPALFRMWRELLAGQVAVQGGLSVGVFAPEEAAACRDLARDHFGAATPLRNFQSAGQVIRNVWRRVVSVGVVPVAGGETGEAWWRALGAGGADSPRIVARLPFWEDPPASADPVAAWAIARLAPEETGDDVTIAAVERRGGVSRARLRALLRARGFAARSLATWQDPEQPDRTSYLVEIDGFVRAGLADDPAALGARFGGGEAAVLGAYARPIRLAAARGA